MGFNTTIFVLNDRWSDIKKDPEAWVDAVSAYGAEDDQITGTTVMPTRHADEFRLYATHQNSIVELSPWATRTMAMAENEYGLREIKAMIEKAERYLAELKKAISK